MFLRREHTASLLATMRKRWTLILESDIKGAPRQPRDLGRLSLEIRFLPTVFAVARKTKNFQNFNVFWCAILHISSSDHLESTRAVKQTEECIFAVLLFWS